MVGIGKIIRSLLIKVGADTSELGKAFDEAKAKVTGTRRELNAVKKELSQKWDNDKFIKAQELAKRHVQELNEEAKVLKEGLAELEKQGFTRTSDEFKNLTAEAKKLDNQIDKAVKEAEKLKTLRFDSLSKRFKDLGTDIESAGKKMLPMSAALTAAAAASVKAASDYEQAFAGVRKTVNATEDENVGAIARVSNETGTPWNVAIDLWEQDNPAAVKGLEDVGAARSEFYRYVAERRYDEDGNEVTE